MHHLFFLTFDSQADHFPFLNLPLEIQIHIYSFLSPIEVIQKRKICRSTKISIDENYLKQLDTQLKFLDELNHAYEQNAKESFQVKLQSCLDTILSNNELENFLERNPNYQSSLPDYLTSEKCINIDWNTKSSETLQSTINIFFKYASNTQLSAFIKKNVCFRKKAFLKSYELVHPNFTNIFFIELTNERRNRLVDLSVVDNSVVDCLVPTIACRAGPREDGNELLALLYEKHPTSKWWHKIRVKASDYSVLIHLLGNIWILDTMALFKQFPSDYDSLSQKIKDLFNAFKFPGRSSYQITQFVSYFLLSAQSLNEDQIKAFACGLINPLFVHRSYDIEFITQTLCWYNFFKKKGLSEEELSNHNRIIIPLLKEFISLKLNSNNEYYFCSFVRHMKNKEQIQAFIEAVKSCGEPWRTLYLRLLILKENGNDRFEEDEINDNEKDAILQDRKDAFLNCQLDYGDYSSLEYLNFQQMFFCKRKKYLQELPKIDSVEKLKNFFSQYKNKKCLLRPLASCLILSKDVTLKPNLDSEIIKQEFANQGLNFDSFNKPISIEDFLKWE